MSEFTSTYAPCWDLLLKRLREPTPARIQLLTGLRQVGKTTLVDRLDFGQLLQHRRGRQSPGVPQESMLQGYLQRTP